MAVNPATTNTNETQSKILPAVVRADGLLPDRLLFVIISLLSAASGRDGDSARARTSSIGPAARPKEIGRTIVNPFRL
jgi:hypothetical protein